MKRRFALFLAMSVTAAAFISCGKNIDINSKEDTDQAKVEDAVQEVEKSAPTYTTTSVAYEGESQYFSGSAQCIQITDGDHEVLAKAVDKQFSKEVKDFNETATSFVKEADEQNKDFAAQAGEDEAEYEDVVFNYSYNIYAEVTRADSQIFSVKITKDIYTGGAHGSHVTEGLVFDTNTGDLLSWDDLGDVVEDTKAFVFSSINDSDADVKSMLFEDYEDSINTSFDSSLEDLSMWLDKRGLVVAFSEYSIAPYAAGNVSFTVPYSMLESFNKSYLPEDGFYSFELSQLGLVDKVDVDGDGTLDKVELVNTYDEESYTSDYTLYIKDASISLIPEKEKEEYSYASVHFVHREDGNYILASLSGAGNTQLTKLLTLTGDEVRELDSVDMGVYSINENGAELSTMVDALGSWEGVKKYTFDNMGFSTEDKDYHLYNNPRKDLNAVGLTLKQPVTFEDESGDEPKTADKGQTIYPHEIKQNAVSFLSKDGQTLGYLIFEEKSDGTRYINGISEYDLFESLPYSG